MSSPRKQSSLGCNIAVVVILCLVGFGVWSVYESARESMQAEQNLHSTLFVIRLVNHYVQEHGRWPDSWKELEAMQFGSESPRSGAEGTNIVRIGGAMNFKWPEQSRELRERVAIDFVINEADVVAQDVVEFKPIHPIGPYFNYWKYGFIEDLQDSLAEQRKGTAEQPREPPESN
jgi:hypothetical protein